MNDKNALRWLRQERIALHSAVKQDPDGVPGGNLQENLRNLQSYWKTIWEREGPFCQEPDATHDHIMWNCPQNNSGLSPVDALQARLGWPGW